MRNFYKKLTLGVACLAVPSLFKAQCGVVVNAGSATNLFTIARNPCNPVAVNKALNTVVIVHRNNINSFGGSSGSLRYDVSSDGGNTWSSDQGVLNPLLTSAARYPNAFIYNPAANTTPANAYVGYMGATIDAGSNWNGMVTGVRQLSGTGTTEHYNQPAASPTGFIPGSVVKGAQGVFWAADGPYSPTTLNVTGFYIYKGTWNSATSDIDWSLNYTINPPFNTSYAGQGMFQDYNIAFDPTGTYGWFSALTDVTAGSTTYSYKPVFYKTVNGGATWTGPIQVDLSAFGCITNNAGGTNGAGLEHDLAVDVNGNPHMFTTIGNGANYYMNYFAWHHMADITLQNGVWVANDVANVNASYYTYGAATANPASLFLSPHIARTADGTKMFYTWLDNSTYALGGSNQTPNLFGRAFDVQTNNWTNVKDFTSCNPATDGKIIWPHVAEEVLEPATGGYKIAAVYGEFAVANDPGQTVNLKFLNNTTFAAAEFTVPAPVGSLAMTPSNSLLICPGSTVNVGVTGNYDAVLWNTGSTNATIPVSTSSVYTAMGRVNCIYASSSITVSTVVTNLSSSSNDVCTGHSAVLSVSGNAYNYLWTHNGSNSPTVSISPNTNTIYTVTATGDQNCIVSSTIAINVFQSPVITVAGNNTVCAGAVVTQTAGGGITYSWDNGASGSTADYSPAANGVFTVTGTDANGCSSDATFTLQVKAAPLMLAVANKTIICRGETALLTANGATTYSWTTGSAAATATAAPLNTTTYSVTGTNAIGCSKTVTVTQVVDACISIKENNADALISIYPNPNNGEFTITLPDHGAATQISIYNTIGKLVAQQNITANATAVDLREQPAGVYFISVSQNGKQLTTSKLVKQ